MKLFFTKMQGAGNDFIVIDQVTQEIVFNRQWVTLLANRKTGIGCDQLLLLEPPKSANCDFFYRIFNSDGSEVEQCGNGARCIGQFIAHKQLSPKASWELETISSSITVALAPNNQGYRVNLGIPNFSPDSLPFRFNNTNIIDEIFFKINLDLGIQNELIFSVLSLGNPHVVINLENTAVAQATQPEQINYINTIGKFLNEHLQFPHGVNVNFMRVMNSNTLELMTYERGVGITMACGTGACASAVSAIRQNLVNSHSVTVENIGGSLGVNWSEGEKSSVWLTGKSSIVYEGWVEL